MSYVYIRSDPHLFTVGFYSPAGKWHAESDWEEQAEAAERVHYLNGGRQEEPDPAYAEYNHIRERSGLSPLGGS